MKYKITLLCILIIIYIVANVSWFFVPEFLTLHPLIMAICGVSILIILKYDALHAKADGGKN